MMSANWSGVGGGFDEESCGMSTLNADTSSSVTAVAFSTTTDIQTTLPHLRKKRREIIAKHPEIH